MRKSLVALLVSVSLYAEVHTILFHGHANHLESTNEKGTKFNEMNYGLGYMYSDRDNEDFYFSYGGNVIKDSYNHAFPTLTAAMNYSLFNTDYGELTANITGLVGLRTSESGESVKGLIGAIPGLSYKYDIYSLNYNFSPTVDAGSSSDGERTTGFHYFSLGIDF